MNRFALVAVAAVFIFGAAASASTGMEDLMTVKTQLDKFSPVTIKVDSKLLDARQKKMVKELVAAADYIDKIFLMQVYENNYEIKKKLEASKGKKSALLEYFKINYGPFDRLDHDKPFVEGVGFKPLGANFYPSDMTKDEFEKWLKKHPKDRPAFESNFTVIKRDDKRLIAVPYSVEYKDFLEPAADHLRKAAKYADNATLKKYLLSRADSFLSNDYYQSDVDWVRMKDHDIEVVIGPYEVYEDSLFGYKAAFEAFVTRVDPKESERLAKVVAYMGDLEKNLPIDDRYKGLGRNLESPIIVAQEIYTAGDTRAGVQTLAFNLPNDERVRKEEGSKKVMLKNVQTAKFNKVLIPIAKKVLDPKDVANVDYEAFFAHTLLHEVSHGIGPGEIVKNGRKTTVNKELKELYSVIEEAKADVLGAYNNVYLTKKGLYEKNFIDVIWPTYLAGMFRSVRFGINEAHGGANAIQFSYLLDKGAVKYNEKTGLFSIDETKIDSAVRSLASELLMIEARGDYESAKKFVAKYRKMPESMKNAISRLDSVPVDIKPTYAIK
ncbi:MAG TPA: peptidase [bacterium]|nr:peptidase [Myxococcales bacterium]OQA59424.1 MAG: Peptidase family M49 [bacterium ADurb.Bin270]HPW44872.1 peptidase [bacterium]HQG13004.1 peptidase [bacterium]HQH79861.1 peptidase [bacterium]